jgi:hypothetical protein
MYKLPQRSHWNSRDAMEVCFGVAGRRGIAMMRGFRVAGFDGLEIEKMDKIID